MASSDFIRVWGNIHLTIQIHSGVNLLNEEGFDEDLFADYVVSLKKDLKKNDMESYNKLMKFINDTKRLYNIEQEMDFPHKLLDTGQVMRWLYDKIEEISLVHYSYKVGHA